MSDKQVVTVSTESLSKGYSFNLVNIANYTQEINVIEIKQENIVVEQVTAPKFSEEILGMQQLAERLMFDSTALVAKMDAIAMHRNPAINITFKAAEPSSTKEKLVPVNSVIRGGCTIISSVSILSLAATAWSGAIIIQPLVAIMLLLSCVGFYVMTISKS